MLIEIRDLYKTYFMDGLQVEALRGVSLDLEAGELLTIMGPSGSGKSTFMHILGCLDRPTRGTYLLEGREVGKLGRDELAHLRSGKIGFVFQGFNLLARLSARENVELPLLYSGVAARERRRRAREALRAVGLQERERHYPNQLSGGEQQRVAIARALINGPPLILADEPTGNLDTRTGEEVMALFQQLNAEKGITLILVTHEPDIAKYGRRLVLFRDGRISKDEAIGGTP